MWPETFADCRLRIADLGVQKRNRMPQKQGFPAHYRVRKASPNAGMAGWGGGRDRTSEWRNQNPLPYRLATPQTLAQYSQKVNAFRHLRVSRLSRQFANCVLGRGKIELSPAEGNIRKDARTIFQRYFASPELRENQMQVIELIEKLESHFNR